VSVDKLCQLIESAFPPGDTLPVITLKQGDDIDAYGKSSEEKNAVLNDWRSIPDEYLVQYQNGLIYLDAQSWRYYLPAFLRHAVCNANRVSPATDACLSNLRPPDKEPPRLKTISPTERTAIVSALEYLAFDLGSVYQETACQVLEEYWVEKSLYGDS